MSSTNMFQGLGNDGKPSSRVLRPPGGGSSNLFGQCDDDDDVSSVRKSHKMSSTIFAPPEERQESPKRNNPPGGKESGIFGQVEDPIIQPRPSPPTGVSSSIFWDAEGNLPAARSHPNKPKDNIGIHCTPRPEVTEQTMDCLQKENISVPPAAGQSVPAPCPEQEPDSPSHSVEDHEPRLGPRPRSHNKVIHPPGGKSSVVFY